MPRLRTQKQTELKRKRFRKAAFEDTKLLILYHRPSWGGGGTKKNVLASASDRSLHNDGLAGPTAILFISCDACSDSIAKLFCVCWFFFWRDALQNGVSHRCAFVKLSTKGGIASIWGSANVHLQVARDMGYRSDGIATSRGMGPLRQCFSIRQKVQDRRGQTDRWENRGRRPFTGPF